MTGDLLGETSDDDEAPIIVRYFVDEAGTPTLFDHKGKVSVGDLGCSKYFMLGKLDVTDPALIAADMATLRAKLLADPYFARVPSLDPAKKKTAVLFHAKDDLPEIRDRVFHLLMKHDVKFSAVVLDKHKLAAQVLARNQADPTYHYRENEIYDELVSHLFKTGFHEADHFEITFAERGNKDRSKALGLAIEHARTTYQVNLGVQSQATVDVKLMPARKHAGLQAVDYFLWALQRFYERPSDSSDDRYWELVRSKARLVYDKDDHRQNSFGVYYTPEKPLTRDARA